MLGHDIYAHAIAAAYELVKSPKLSLVALSRDCAAGYNPRL